MIRSARSQLLLLSFVSAIGQLSCKSDSAAVTGNSSIPDVSELKIAALTSTSFDGIVGAMAPFSPAVRVTNSETQQPVANVEVHFTGSAVGFEKVLTDADGIASAGVWRFSTKAGKDSLAVLVGKRVLLHFVASLTHDAPTDIHVSNDGELVGLAGSEVAGFGMQVVDQYGNGVPGVSLSFSVNAGAVDSSRVISDRGGGAYTGHWLLDETPGTSLLTITADGLRAKVVAGIGLDSSALRWYKLVEKRIDGNVIPLSDFDTPEARFGLTGMETCPCISGFYVDERTFRLTQTVVARYGGRYVLSGRSLQLSESNPSSAGAIRSGKIEDDRLSIDRLYFVGGPLPDPVFVTFVYAPDR
jgi:hypothetical protein